MLYDHLDPTNHIWYKETSRRTTSYRYNKLCFIISWLLATILYRDIYFFIVFSHEKSEIKWQEALERHTHWFCLNRWQVVDLSVLKRIVKCHHGKFCFWEAKMIKIFSSRWSLTKIARAFALPTFSCWTFALSDIQIKRTHSIF